MRLFLEAFLLPQFLLGSPQDPLQAGLLANLQVSPLVYRLLNQLTQLVPQLVSLVDRHLANLPDNHQDLLLEFLLDNLLEYLPLNPRTQQVHQPASHPDSHLRNLLVFHLLSLQARPRLRPLTTKNRGARWYGIRRDTDLVDCVRTTALTTEPAKPITIASASPALTEKPNGPALIAL